MTTTTKTRNQSPIVARRKLLRSVMNRAKAIAFNALNAHNSSLDRVAEFGGAVSVKEFMPEAMRLAWQEVKTGETIYQMVQGLPRKTMPLINLTVKAKVIETNANVELSQADRHHEQAIAMLAVRSAKPASQADLDLAKSIAYGFASDTNYALEA